MKALCFGEILWDVYPDKKALGGAPLNFAAHLAKHGVQSFLLSAVGDDENGAEALAEAARWGVLTDHIAVCPQWSTGSCRVTLDAHSVPSYHLVEDVAYDHIPCPHLPEEFHVLYFGTLALRGEENLQTLSRLLEQNRFREVFVDVNIRPPFYSAQTLTFAVENATILKVSLEELPLLYEALGADPAAPWQRIGQILRPRCGKLRRILVTLGEAGAWALDCGSGEVCVCGGVQVEAVSTVGAGDSFSAAFLAKLLEGEPVQACLAHGVQVAAFVVSRLEAVPGYDPRDFS